ncbi:MAG: hypothetical protein SVY41_02885 [Candidatus Nanohaloarchaea archaeon]|nr:hypothetical protein [Candidatus Nanohaloarchaea archaeon]
MPWHEEHRYLTEDDLFDRLVEQNAHWLQQYLNAEIDDEQRFRAFAAPSENRDEYTAEIRVFDLESDWDDPYRDEPAITIRAELRQPNAVGSIEDMAGEYEELRYPVEYFLNEEWREDWDAVVSRYKLGAPEFVYGHRPGRPDRA